MQTNRLTFIVPGLLDPVPYLDQLPAQELPELPIFSSMLSQGRWSYPDDLDESHHNYYTSVLNELGIPESIRTQMPSSSSEQDSHSLPIASVSYFYDADKLSETGAESLYPGFKNKWLMRVDPCFMAPDRDQLVLAKIDTLDISMAEARQLVNEINEFFHHYEEENFWTLTALTPKRWYIVSDKPIAIQTVPPENVLGQSVKSFLINGKLMNGDDSGHWLNLFNEFQMILHQSSVNKQRITKAKQPINSLWLWGACRSVDFSELSKNAPHKQKNTTIYTDDIFAQGLAKLINQKHINIPDRYQPLTNNEQQRVIYIIRDFMNAIKNKDVFSWVGLLQQFEKHYLIPLMDEIKAGKITEVEFVSPSGTRLLLTKKLVNRWWRKKTQYYKILCVR